MMRRRASAFTLLELLITIAIIALLAAILLAALRAVREQARLTNCQSNIREIIKGAVNWSTRQAGTLRNTLPGGPPQTYPLNFVAASSISGQTTLFDGNAPAGLQVRNHGAMWQARDIQSEEVYYCPDQVSPYFSNTSISGFTYDDGTGANISRWTRGNVVRSSYAFRSSLQASPGSGSDSSRVIYLERDGTREPVLADAFTASPTPGDLRFAHSNTKYAVGFGDGRTVVFEDPRRDIETLGLAEPTSASDFLTFEDPATGPWSMFKRS